MGDPKEIRMMYSRNLVCPFTAHQFERCHVSVGVCVWVCVSLHTHNDGYRVWNYILRVVVAIGNIKFNHFDYCFHKLSLGYTVIINHNPQSYTSIASNKQRFIFFLFYMPAAADCCGSAQSLYPRHNSALRISPWLDFMIKRKETTTKPYRDLTDSVWIGQGHYLCLSTVHRKS